MDNLLSQSASAASILNPSSANSTPGPASVRPGIHGQGVVLGNIQTSHNNFQPSNESIKMEQVPPNSADSSVDASNSNALLAVSTPTTASSLSRGRAPKDPRAQTYSFQCTSLDEMEDVLRNYLQDPPGDPHHSTADLMISGGTAFQVNLSQNENYQPTPTADSFATELTMVDALDDGQHPTSAMNKQRAIAKACIEAVQRIDGYRYSFHNKWRSGEENAHRFSYYCNDSFLNKDRVANGKGAAQGKRAMKAVYDCKGVIAVKFSAARQCLNVVYKHIPLHKTYEERAPLPRKDSKRRVEWEQTSHGPIDSSRVRGLPAPTTPVTEGEVAPSKKKRKRHTIAGDKVIVEVLPENDARLDGLHTFLDLTHPQPTGMANRDHSGLHGASNGFLDGTQARAQGRCSPCVAKRVQCDGVLPTCSACVERGNGCFYLKSAEEVMLTQTTGVQEDLAEQIREKGELEQQVGVLTDEMDTLRQDLERSKQEVERLTTSVNESGDKIRVLEEENATLSTQFNQVNKKLTTVQAAHAQAQAAQLQAQHAAAQAAQASQAQVQQAQQAAHTQVQQASQTAQAVQTHSKAPSQQQHAVQSVPAAQKAVPEPSQARDRTRTPAQQHHQPYPRAQPTAQRQSVGSQYPAYGVSTGVDPSNRRSQYQLQQQQAQAQQVQAQQQVHQQAQQQAQQQVQVQAQQQKQAQQTPTQAQTQAQTQQQQQQHYQHQLQSQHHTQAQLQVHPHQRQHSQPTQQQQQQQHSQHAQHVQQFQTHGQHGQQHSQPHTAQQQQHLAHSQYGQSAVTQHGAHATAQTQQHSQATNQAHFQQHSQQQQQNTQATQPTQATQAVQQQQQQAQQQQQQQRMQQSTASQHGHHPHQLPHIQQQAAVAAAAASPYGGSYSTTPHSKTSILGAESGTGQSRELELTAEASSWMAVQQAQAQQHATQQAVQQQQQSHPQNAAALARSTLLQQQQAQAQQQQQHAQAQQQQAQAQQHQAQVQQQQQWAQYYQQHANTVAQVGTPPAAGQANAFWNNSGDRGVNHSMMR